MAFLRESYLLCEPLVTLLLLKPQIFTAKKLHFCLMTSFLLSLPLVTSSPMGHISPSLNG